jgi:hypothetical protein
VDAEEAVEHRERQEQTVAYREVVRHKSVGAIRDLLGEERIDQVVRRDEPSVREQAREQGDGGQREEDCGQSSVGGVRPARRPFRRLAAADRGNRSLHS